MPRFALVVEYDGRGFVGWQWQDGQVSVQRVLQQAASRLVGGAPVVASAAGRTDAGVHAEAQVAMIDLSRQIAPEKLRDALNFHLRPHAVAVVHAAIAPDDFHPRFDAIGRAYRYVILNRPAPPVLEAGRAWHVNLPLDARAMHEAAQTLLGRHDFTSFRASSCQANSPIRTLDRLSVSRRGEAIEVVAEARSFLHHQVRNMVGTLKLVGEGRWPAGRVGTALAAADRSASGPTAPPDGLTLTRVCYPPEIEAWLYSAT